MPDDSSSSEEDDYRFAPLDLESPNAEHRRWAVMHISRNVMAEYGEKLLVMLESDPDIGVRRHVIRALAKLRHPGVVPILRRIFERERGLILGDALRAMAELRAPDLASLAGPFCDSENTWVAESARWALSRARD